MKQHDLFFIFITVVLLAAGCKKDSTPADNINYQPINDTLIGIKSDFLVDFGCPTIFEIYRNSNNPPDDTLSVKVMVNPDLVLGCGGPDFLEGTHGLKSLGQNYVINGEGNWDGTDDGFEEFIGQGESYLAFRDHPDTPDLQYSYAWIRIRISAHCDTLLIIDYARNLSYNNSIKAGQIK